MRHLSTPVIILIAVASAVGLNQLVFAAGAALGARFEFNTAGELLTVDPVTLAGFTALPLTVGLSVAGLLSLRWRWVIPTALVVGPILALGSIAVMTVPAGFDGASFVTLALCHAVLVPVLVVALRGIARRRSPVSALA